MEFYARECENKGGPDRPPPPPLLFAPCSKHGSNPTWPPLLCFHWFFSHGRCAKLKNVPGPDGLRCNLGGGEINVTSGVHMLGTHAAKRERGKRRRMEGSLPPLLDGPTDRTLWQSFRPKALHAIV